MSLAVAGAFLRVKFAFTSGNEGQRTEHVEFKGIVVSSFRGEGARAHS